MRALHDDLRRELENTIKEARRVAERAAGAAVERLAVGNPKPYGHMDEQERELRRRLRAHGRAQGDELNRQSGEQETWHLVREMAYQHWHRMMFARFLAENDLLMHPEGVAVTLEECEELAREEGARDGWSLAERYAARMLPQIFRPDDPVLQVSLSPEDQQELERLLDGLPSQVFTADDSLGWTYQFWQAERKDEVNASNEKVGADEIPAVTQLFTEDYMVQFLLDNTLGAWWAGKYLEEHPEVAGDLSLSEDQLRDIVAPEGCSFNYLRFLPAGADEEDDEAELPDRNVPAAGMFDGWPDAAKDLKMMDPCCGSGHFMVAGLKKLVPMRMDEEGLSAREACDAVLRDNLHGLEIDQRCTQIAAFAVALAAWTYPDAGGYRELPELSIACSGIPVTADKEEWLALAGDKSRMRDGMEDLYELFQNADTLGSLIDPARMETDMWTAGMDDLEDAFKEAIQREDAGDEVEAEELGVAARGVVRAADMLSDKYHLVGTNVPYLARGKQSKTLRGYAKKWHTASKKDVATMFQERCLGMCESDGSTALVLPQHSLFLTTYAKLREELLRNNSWKMIARLGPGAFEMISGEVVNVALLVLGKEKKHEGQELKGVDAKEPRNASEKAKIIRRDMVNSVRQSSLLRNPDARISLTCLDESQLLMREANGLAGIQTGDYPRFGRRFWEMREITGGWAFEQSTVNDVCLFGGREKSLLWENGEGELYDYVSEKLGQKRVRAWLRGEEAWGKDGVAVSLMHNLNVSLYKGKLFDNNTGVILPNNRDHLPAIWCFCSSPEFHDEVRKIDQALKVTNASLVKIPFDLERWQKVAEAKYPNGLPKPYSDDPTQWIFHGHPCESVIWDDETKWTARGSLRTDETVLQVAVGRMLGYRWPAEHDPEMELVEEAREIVEECEALLPHADEDGIVCLPSVHGEKTAADRLRTMLSAAYGDEWSPDVEAKLLATADYEGKSLETWLRDGFFEQHISLFQNRPFIWHIWDGVGSDGFSALVNYHSLDRQRLEKLTYTYLGDWINRQKAAVRRDEAGAEERLRAARELKSELEKIIRGEEPYDIFVRWKPLQEQPIGWEPDLNDGVRQNIRPFMKAKDVHYKRAGLLRKKPNCKWTNDRGKEPERPKEQYPWFWEGDEFTAKRVNDEHLSLEEKRAARERAEKRSDE